jgi:hypothetical protein
MWLVEDSTRLLAANITCCVTTAAAAAAAAASAGECAAPVISLSKEANMADLLGPVMRRADAEVVHRHAPWGSKKNKAFFRWAAGFKLFRGRVSGCLHGSFGASGCRGCAQACALGKQNKALSGGWQGSTLPQTGFVWVVCGDRFCEP